MKVRQASPEACVMSCSSSIFCMMSMAMACVCTPSTVFTSQCTTSALMKQLGDRPFCSGSSWTPVEGCFMASRISTRVEEDVRELAASC